MARTELDIKFRGVCPENSPVTFRGARPGGKIVHLGIPGGSSWNVRVGCDQIYEKCPLRPLSRRGTSCEALGTGGPGGSVDCGKRPDRSYPLPVEVASLFELRG